MGKYNACTTDYLLTSAHKTQHTKAAALLLTAVVPRQLVLDLDPTPLPLGGGDLHDDPRVKFQMAVVLFSFLVRTMLDHCTFVVQTTMGSFEVNDDADLNAVKALISLPFVQGISELFPDE